MTTQLKVTKAVLGFAVAVTAAATTLATVLVQVYVGNPTISAATGVFITAIGAAGVVFLTTEEQAAPAA